MSKMGDRAKSSVGAAVAPKNSKQARRTRAGDARAALRRSAEVACESLERRVLMATVTWNTDAAGSWENPANWMASDTGTGRVPTTTDDVVINRPGFSPTVTITGNESVHSLTAKSPLDVASGGLTVNANSEIFSALTLDGGGVGVPVNVTLTLDSDTTWVVNGFGGAGTVKNAGHLTLTRCSWTDCGVVA